MSKSIPSYRYGDGRALTRYAAGESDKELADAYGVSPHTIRRWASLAGVKRGSSQPVGMGLGASAALRTQAGVVPATITRNDTGRLMPGSPESGARQPEHVNLRRCRNMDCDVEFVPVNAHHVYHEPACAKAEPERKKTVRQILSDEAGLDHLGGNMELAKSAFGQKNQLLRRVSGLQALRDYLRYEVQTYNDEYPELRLPHVGLAPSVCDGKDEREIILSCSDWQVGKLEAGIGKDVMVRERLPRIINATEGIIEQYRKGEYRISRAHIAFAGDLIEGCYIYAGQNVTGLDKTSNTHRLINQIRLAADMQAHVIRHMASLVDEVVVHSVPGNHGRTNGRNDFTDPEDNFDTLVAYMAQDKLANQRNIVWDISEDWKATFKSFGHKVAMFHGDQWRGDLWKLDHLLPQWVTGGMFGDEIPSLVLCGHRHDFVTYRVNGITVCQNGTIDGGSGWYQRAYGRSSKPTQTVIVTSERFAPEAILPIYF